MNKIPQIESRSFVLNRADEWKGSVELGITPDMFMYIYIFLSVERSSISEEAAGNES